MSWRGVRNIYQYLGNYRFKRTSRKEREDFQCGVGFVGIGLVQGLGDQVEVRGCNESEGVGRIQGILILGDSQVKWLKFNQNQEDVGLKRVG